jgi:hypothetical protein
MERNFNEDRRFKIYADKLFSIHASNNLIIETSYNNIDFSSNAVIFDGHVELNRVICNNISISNVSEISSNFVYVNNIDLPSNNKLKYNSVNNGYIRNTSIGIDNTSYTIGRSDAYFTYINVSGGDASFNTNLTINKDLRIDGTLTISNDLLINGNNFASIENSFNIYRAALEQNFYSAKIVTNDLSASAISISNNLVALKTAYFNDISINGQLLNNVLKVPALFTIDPSGHGNASGTLIINGDLTVNGLQTSIASSVVDICDQAITLASNLVLANIQDLSKTNAGLDISNIASLKYDGTLWNFGGGQLTVQNKKVLLIDDLSLAKRDFDLSINEFKADFSSSFFALKRNIDNSYNATYSRSQITNKFILKSNFDISSTSLLSYVDSSYISKSTFTISYGDILTLMDTSYVEQIRVGALNSFTSSFNTFNEKLDISYLLNSVFEASHNKIKTDFDISFATINANNISTSASSITIENINTKHSSQRFANSLWNQIGLDISSIPNNKINNNKNVVISNDGTVVAMSLNDNLSIQQVEQAVQTLTTRDVGTNGSAAWNAICWSPELGIFVVGSYIGIGIMTSSNGINWTTSSVASGESKGSICWSPQLRLFVAVFWNGYAMTSTNGINWSQGTTFTTAGWYSVCWAAELGIFVAVGLQGTNNRTMTSRDGLNWTRGTNIPQSDWISVVWSPELRLFVAVSVGSTANYAMTSSNGINWTMLTNALFNYGWKGLCWSPQLGIFVSIANSNMVMTSNNGINWNIYTSGPPNGIETSLSWSPQLELFFSTSNSGTIATSSNGINWTTRTSTGTGYRCSCWSPELGIFVSPSVNGYVLTSSLPTTSRAGSVYIYELSYNNWDRLGNNTIVGLSGDELGYSLALSSNGRIVAASSLYKDASAGQVRVYELSNNTNSWIQKGSNINGPRPGSESGYSISLAGNGNRIAIGAWKDNLNGTNAGAIRVYDFSSNINDWRQQGQTIAGISGSFEGYSTALSLDGQTLASGSIVEPSTNIITVGPVKTFTISGNTWINKGIIQGPQIYLGTISATSIVAIDAAIPGFYDPLSAAINFDGTIIAKTRGERNADIIQVWKYSNNSWTELASPSPTAMTYYPELSDDGTICVYSGGQSVGGEWSLVWDTGFVEVRRYNPTTFVWTQIFKRMETNWVSLERCALSKDGKVVAITTSRQKSDYSENNPGVVNVYKYVSDMNWTAMGQTLTGTSTIKQLATGIALSYTGDFMVCSTYLYSSYRGIARIYRFNSPVASQWNLIGEITGPVAGKYFGWYQAAMSSNGQTIAIGSYGYIYVYKYNSDMNWIQIGAIRGPNIYDEHFYYPTLSSDGTVVGLAQGGARGISDKPFVDNRAIQLWKYVNSEWILIYNTLSTINNNVQVACLSGNGKSFLICPRAIPSRLYTVTNITYQSTPYIENLLYSTNKTKYLNLFFGRDIKLSSNGNNIVIGATGPTNTAYIDTSYSFYNYNQGSIYTYEYAGSGTTWRQLGQIIHGISGGDEFGSSVSMSNDGTLISVGSNNNNYNRGQVRVFAYVNNYWYQLSNSINGKISNSKAGIHALSGDGRTLIQTNNTYNSVYGLNRSLAFIPSTTTISTTISGDLAVTGKAYLKSFRISNKHNFDVSINGYSSHYLATTDISASIVDYYSNVGYIYNKVFKIDACGNVSNYSGLYGAVSDSRLKENIVNCGPKLADLLKVRVVNYNLKGSDKTKYIGVLAQELEELFPELVVEDNTHERIKSVNYSNLTIMLIKAFQEQQVLINNLYASLECLEN